MGESGLVGLKVIHSEPGTGASQLGCLNEDDRGCEWKMSSSVTADRLTESSGQLLDLMCEPRSEATVRSLGRTAAFTGTSGKPPRVAFKVNTEIDIWLYGTYEIQ
jgi:hypothetical protein